MNENLMKNSAALFNVDEPLAFALRSLKQVLNYEILPNLNIKNKQLNALIFDENEEKSKLEFFKNHFSKHPVLFIYGFANGRILKELLKNDKHKRIIVFEKELEILYLALSADDFSKDIKDERLIIFYTPNLNAAQFNALFTYEFIRTSLKAYNFNILSQFYEKNFENELKSINAQLITAIKFAYYIKGNDPKDSLIGIENMLLNLKKQIEHGIFKDFLKQRHQKAKSAIVVSTGPSLTKQLPLLKKYADKASIFCVDGSYAILAKAGIKPDFVLSLERIDFTSEFFNNDFGDFDKDILFILCSVTHPKTLAYLEKNKREYMLVSRPLLFALFLNLPLFGYLGTGHSVANMAFELACALKHEEVIFIGQDLAYANDGSSHPSSYQYGANSDSIEHKSDEKVLAYGGKDYVSTQLSWNLFRQALQRDIALVKTTLKTRVINATEGGARIEGTEEVPFKQVCEKILAQNLNKPFQMPAKLEISKAKELFDDEIKFLKKALSKSSAFLQECKSELKELERLLPKDYEFSELDFKALRQKKIKFEELFKRLKKEVIFTEALDAIYFHNECELVRFETLSFKDDEEERKMLCEWLEFEAGWFVQAGEFIFTQDKLIAECLEKIQGENDDKN